MASETLTRLRNMAKKMPATDEKAAARAQAAQATQFQAGLSGAPQGTPVTQASQQIGAQMASAQGATAAAQKQQSLGKAAQVGQAAIQEQKFQGSQELQKQERSQGLALGNAARQQALAGQEADILARKKVTTSEIDQAKRLQAFGIDQDNRLQTLTLKQREDVAKLGRDVKAKLFDAQLIFEKDERGRKFSNERQLMDYAISNTQANWNAQDMMQKMQQDADKDMIMLEAMNNRLKQALQHGYMDKNQKLDQESKRRIAAAIQANEERMRKKAAEAANRGMMIKGALTVAGTAVGAAYGAPTAGAFLGSSAGDLAAGAAG